MYLDHVAATQAASPSIPRPLDLGRILDGAFTMGRSHFGTLAVLTVVAAVPLQVAISIPLARSIERVDVLKGTTGVNDATGSLAAWVTVAITVWFLSPVIDLALAGPAAVKAWLMTGDGALAEFRGWARRCPTILAAVAVEIAFVFGPGILLLLGAVRTSNAGLGLLFSFVGVPWAIWLGPVMIYAPLEAASGAGPLRALRASWSLVRRNFWRSVAVVVCVQLICVVTLLLPALVVYGFGPRAGPGLVIYLTTIGAILQVVVAPFRVAAVAANWVDLRVRREGFDIEVYLNPNRALASLP